MVDDRGATLLEGDASVGRHVGPSELDRRLAALAPLAECVVLKDVAVGMRTARRPVTMAFEQRMGALCPFTLEDKLAVITEPSPWHAPETGTDSPWGRATIPLEMATVLMKYTDEDPPFPVPPEVVCLIAHQEIRLLDGPLFVGQRYELDQEVIAFSGSRRTESIWIRTRLFRAGSDAEVATMLINQASLKETLAA